VLSPNPQENLQATFQAEACIMLCEPFELGLNEILIDGTADA
jgi:hypothetical protein